MADPSAIGSSLTLKTVAPHPESPTVRQSSRQSLAKATRKGGSIGWGDTLDWRGDALVKFAGWITRSLQANMRAELGDIERAASNGTRDAGRGLKTELRRQVSTTGLGQRLANNWRDRHYPNRKLDAASLVYTKAPQIIRAFDEGALIRSRRGRFLAIPTENAPRKGTDGKRISPSTFPEHRFGPLRFVPRPSGPSLLVVDGLRAWLSRKTGGLRGFRRATKRGRQKRPGPDHGRDVPARAAGEAPEAARRYPHGQHWSAQLPALIEQQLRSE
jgi:hypothetical protein